MKRKMAAKKSQPEVRRDLFATRTGQKSKMVYVKRFVILSGSGCGCGLALILMFQIFNFYFQNLLGLNLDSPRIYCNNLIYNSIELNWKTPISIHDFIDSKFKWNQ